MLSFSCLDELRLSAKPIAPNGDAVANRRRISSDCVSTSPVAAARCFGAWPAMLMIRQGSGTPERVPITAQQPVSRGRSPRLLQAFLGTSVAAGFEELGVVRAVDNGPPVTC